MKRIMIIGCCGAGKSTFARKLYAKTQLPLIHLDQEFWQPNWVETEEEAWKEKVTELANRPMWIIDGNYGGTMDVRQKVADTIIFFDYPTMKCLARVVRRIIQHHGKVRPDMPEGCHERFDFDFLHYVATFNIVKRKGILKKLAKAKEQGKEVVIFKNDQAADDFLKRLSDIN